jgi:hypothetical protein
MIIESAQPYAQHPPTATELAPAVLDSDKHRLIHAAVTNIIAKPQINAVSAVPLSIARDRPIHSRGNHSRWHRTRPLPAKSQINTRILTDGTGLLPDGQVRASVVPGTTVLGDR